MSFLVGLAEKLKALVYLVSHLLKNFVFVPLGFKGNLSLLDFFSRGLKQMEVVVQESTRASIYEKRTPVDRMLGEVLPASGRSLLLGMDMFLGALVLFCGGNMPFCR